MARRGGRCRERGERGERDGLGEGGGRGGGEDEDGNVCVCVCVENMIII